MRRLSRALFDVSHGQKWNMPNLRFPSTSEEAETLAPQDQALVKRGDAEDQATWARIRGLEAKRNAAGRSPEEAQ